MEKEILTSLSLIGLTPNEAKIYLFVYQNGKTKAGDIIKNISIPRATVYQLLETLVKKGFILKIDTGNILHYIAEEPSQFLQFLEDEEHELGKKKKIFHYMLPKLEKLKNQQDYTPKVVYFEGKQQYISLLDDVLESGVKQVFMITNTQINSQHIGDEVKNKDIHTYESGEFLEERLKRKIKLYLITSGSNIAQELEKKDANELRVTKILPADFGDVETFVLYGDKILLLTDNHPIIGIYIEDKQLKNMFQNIFQFIWKNI